MIVDRAIYRDGQRLSAHFDLHELAVEDAVKAHQRPKLERYGDAEFLVLRPARYVDATETVEFGEIHVFAGPQFVMTVRHGEAPDLHRVREKLERRPDLLARGTGAIVHAILDQVVDDDEPVVEGLQQDIDEIEDDVFDGSATASRRIYDLTREVKKISAWAAIFFAPTFVGTIYGMNFEHMPELRWELGYPFALALMVAIALGLWGAFKRAGWL